MSAVEADSYVIVFCAIVSVVLVGWWVRNQAAVASSPPRTVVKHSDMVDVSRRIGLKTELPSG